jgi:hypothetical protein
MAIITETIEPTVKVFPLEIEPQLRQQRSGFPRAVVDAVYKEATWSAPGAGNEKAIKVNYRLPANFAYAFAGFTWAASQASVLVNNWQAPWHVIYPDDETIDNAYWTQPPVAGDLLTQIAVPTATDAWKTFSSSQDTNLDSIIFTPKRNPVPGKAFGPEVIGYIYNTTTNVAPGSVFYRARYLQYDISQAFAFPVNFSIPTR